VIRARWRIEDDLRRVRRELGTARTNNGLSIEQVAVACGVAPSTAWRTESGVTRQPDLLLLAGMAAAVGHDVRLQIYPAGDALRDGPQQRLLERVRQLIHPTLEWRTEVALPNDADLRAWDAVIRGPGWRLPVEAETVVSDVQALERRLARKMRDGHADRVILVVADTRRNRVGLAAAPAGFGGFDRKSRSILGRLRRGQEPTGSSIVFL
jgi:transcriptional regulator with XRE-family HTH domain